MRVFTPAQSKSAAEERTSKDALRAKGLASITHELLDEKNRAERDFEETMKNQREIAEHWFSDNLIRKNQLTKEIEDLEGRRERALSPLIQREEDIQSKEEDLAIRITQCGEKESENDEVTRILMRRLDEVSSKEQDLFERERQLRRREEGCEMQRTQVAEGSRLLNIQIMNFNEKIEEKEVQFAYKKSEQDAITQLQSEKENGYLLREKKIHDDNIVLADQRELLKQGFEELRRKQHAN